MSTLIEPNFGQEAAALTLPRPISPQPKREFRRRAVRPSRAGARYLAQVALTSMPLMLADLLAITASVLIAATVSTPFAAESAFALVALLAPLCAALLFANLLFGLYPAIGQTPTFEIRQASISTTFVFSVFVAVVMMGGVAYPPGVAMLLATGAATLVLVPLLRSLARTICCNFDWWGHPVLIFDSGDEGRDVYEYLCTHRRQGLRPIGLMDAIQRQWRDGPSETPVYLDPPAIVQQEAKKHGVYWGVIAMPRCSQVELVDVMEKYAAYIPHLVIMQEITELPCLWNRAHESVGLPGIRIKERLLLPLPRIAKRALDIAIVMMGGVVILPVLAAICVLVKATSRGPIFYKQKRLGQGERHFYAWKFRTMFADADKCLDDYLEANPHLREEWERDHKLRNDPRVTRVGNLLRKTSLDELPQIWNVLRGEMSLVGPRPIVDEEIEKYGETFALYTKVQPGITGLWQVSGRNNTSYPERVALDAHYVRNWSPWFDLYILIRTIKVVLKREGAF
ncbi:MAG: undecaprenyl-phosphate galactose phosphotransferase WbaP [Planctomycetales bacterium]|nr:undecaprenyl-phosphate galactose phosphotransferase WbaP [Planctomycetales bacterium]